jgi:hypothetical protein
MTVNHNSVNVVSLKSVWKRRVKMGYVRKGGKSVHRGDFVKELHTRTWVFKVTPTGGVQTSSL